MINQNTLSGFIGTEQWYRHPLARSVRYTDGVAYLYRNGAAWLVDEIALAQLKPQIALYNRTNSFQCWNLDVAGAAAVLRCDDGNDTVLLCKPIDFTDFPLPNVKLYVVDGVIMLASEY